MWDILGYIASFCFIVCGFPQLILCVKQGHGDGISHGFMWLWLLGELALVFYTSLGLGWNIPLFLNASLCSIICLIIMKYMYFPRNKRRNCTLVNLKGLVGDRDDHKTY